MRRVIDKICAIAAWIIVVICFACIVLRAMYLSEAVECQTLQDNSKTYPSFYITGWQKDMCDEHSISIDAPVIRTYEQQN